MQDTSTRQTLINVGSGVIVTVVYALVGFFLSPFIVRSMGEESNGFTQLAGNFVMYATLFSNAYNSMGGRFMSVSYHRSNIDDTRKIYSSILICNILMVLLLLLPSLCFVVDIGQYVNIETANSFDVKILFACTFLHFFIGQFSSVLTTSVYVRNRMYVLNIVRLLMTVLNALLLLALFSFLPPHIYYVSIVSLLLSVITIPYYYYLKKKLLPSVRFSMSYFNLSKVAELFKSGIWNTINQGGHILMTGCDLLIANLFISPVSMGVLAVSKTVPALIIKLASTLNSNVSPSITINWSQDNRKEVLMELKRNMMISSILVATPIVTFCGFSYEFYQLWMPSLDARKLALLSFLACLPFIPMAGPQTLYNVFTAANKLKVNSISFIMVGLLNIILVYWYLSSGYTGGIYAVAGISSGLTVIRNMTITIPYTARILNLKWYVFYKDVLLSLLCCAVNLVVVLLVKSMVPLSNMACLLSVAFMTAALAMMVECFVVMKVGEREIIYQRILTLKKRLVVHRYSR